MTGTCQKQCKVIKKLELMEAKITAETYDR